MFEVMSLPLIYFNGKNASWGEKERGACWESKYIPQATESTKLL